MLYHNTRQNGYVAYLNRYRADGYQKGKTGLIGEKEFCRLENDNHLNDLHRQHYILLNFPGKTTLFHSPEHMYGFFLRFK